MNDGSSQFAIYSHTTNDGVYVQKYKIASIYSRTPANYIEFLKRYGLTRTDNLLTVWDTFSQESPGETRRIEIGKIDIYNVCDELVKKGMYVAKVVED